jgi:type I restriction enzyme S subunit
MVKRKTALPERWQVEKVRTLCFLGRGKVISEEGIRSHPGIYPVYSSQTMNKGEMGKIDSYDFEGEYVTWTTDGAYAGSVFYRTGRFNCTNVCGTLKAKNARISMKFLAYALSTHTPKYVSYIGNPKLMNNVMAEIGLIVPAEKEEQSKIAEILSSIDNSIDQTDVLINKYQRIKQGLMQDLLTKGIDEKGNIRNESTHKFKDSSVGRIPVEWEVKSFGDFASQVTVKASPRDYRNLICVNLECIESGSGRLLSMSDPNENKSTKTRFSTGDVIFGKLRPYLRKFWLAACEGMCTTEIIPIRAHTGEDTGFLYAVVTSDRFLRHAEAQTFGTKMPRTDWGIISKFLTGYPDEHERHRIVEIAVCTNSAIEKEIMYCSKLRQLKQGLMQDLLTGKVRVTHLLKAG